MESLDFSSPALSEDGFAGGLSNPATVQYKHRRNVLDIVNNLHSAGLQSQLDLPQIAVVGSQSVGKSSLIESISGITLPRAKGTCTRCPIECRLSTRDSPWQCEVYLRRASQLDEIEFGPVVRDKAEIEDRIRRAQVAILNPTRNYEEFLETDDFPERNEVSFSKDFISVRISGREVDDLSFVDLPGIIQSVREGGREADIEEVKSLVASFIKKPSCLILLVVSCETDIENQGARRLAKEVDPQGDRTIPVLTKPDRIAPGEETSWLALLQNQTERFKHGWHCVKQLDQVQLEKGIGWADARELEKEFFDTKTPWSRLDAAVRARLGTEHLTGSLGTTLFALITKRLPSLLKEVNSTLNDTKSKLAVLPEKLEGEPTAIVYDLLDRFKRKITLLVEGRPEDGAKGLIQSFRRDSDIFANSIFHQAPCFRPYEKPKSNEGHFDEDTGEYPSTVKDEDKLEPTGPRDKETFVYFDRVLEMARNARTRELPNNTPFAVKASYIEGFTKGWNNPADDLFKEMERRLSNSVKKLITEHFSNYNTGGLEGTILQIAMSHLDRCSRETASMITKCFDLERKRPFTSNSRDLQEYKSKFADLYRRVRQDYLKSTQGEDSSMLDKMMEILQQFGLGDKKDVLARYLAPDKADDAIDIMAEVRAYYQVAYKRFVDYVPMIIDHNLLQAFDKGLSGALTEGLELGKDGSSQRCAEYLQEDPLTEKTRSSLVHQLRQFEGARARLQNIPGVPFMTGADADASLINEEE